MDIRKVRFFYKEGDHACDVMRKAIADVAQENLQEYNPHDFYHIDDDIMGFMAKTYPHDNVPCMYYKDQKLFEKDGDMTDEELVNAVRDIYDRIKDLPY